MTPIDAILRVCQACPLAVVVPASEGKLPLPVAREEDPAPLFAGHIAGRVPPVLCRKADGTSWTETRGRAIAVRPVNEDGRAAWIGFDFDAAGDGHSTTTPVEIAHAASVHTFAVLREAGMSAVLAASGGGRGRHVWAPLPAPIPVDAADWIARLVARLVSERFPTASIERRPASPNGQGQPLTLPGGGWSPAPGGGAILDAFMPEHRDALRSLDVLLRHHEAVAAREADEAAERERQRERRLASVRPGDVSSADVDLEAIAEAAGEVVRRLGAELHVRCPKCLGTVKIHGKKRAWSCFQCSVGGMGDAAAYTLAKWLRQATEPREVFDVLRAAQAVANV